MIYAFRYAPETGPPQPVGTGEGTGDSAAVDAFEDLRRQSDGVGLPAGEYQYRAMNAGAGAIPGVMPGLGADPGFWAPLVLDPDGTISV